MKTKGLILAIMVLIVACNKKPTDQELAQMRIAQAESLMAEKNYNQAKIELDSVHLLYRTLVNERRVAKYLTDSITYLEAKRTLTYSDSAATVLSAELEKLRKKFRFEKNDTYEDKGKYVHRLLTTGNNNSRCYLQTYVMEDAVVVLKSYYFGSEPLDQDRIELHAEGVQVDCAGKNHAFQSEGWHEIMSVSDADACTLLNFISANQESKLMVKLLGRRTYTYYLSGIEKQALEETYRLAVTSKDYKHYQDLIRVARLQVAKWEKNKNI